MSSKPYQFREETIKCPLCKKYFASPRLLPCLHSFCSSCLANYIKDGKKDNVQDGRNDKPAESKRAGGSPVKEPASKSPVKEMTSSKSPVKETTTKTVPAAAGSPTKDQPGKKLPTGLTTQNKKEGGNNRTSPTKSLSPTRKPPTQKSPDLQGAAKQDQKPKNRSVQYEGSSTGFSCPCCRKFVTIPQMSTNSQDKWAELFPQNNLLADLVDLHSLKLGTRVCDPCKRNQATAQVHSYCKVCRDAMCESCAKTHKGLRSCRNHKVLSTAQFAEAISSLKVEEDLCTEHDGKPKEHYCYTHSKLCCSQCLTESHRSCPRVVSVAEVVKKNKETGQILTIDGALDKYKAYVDTVSKDRSGLLKKLDGKKAKLMTEFVNVKNHIISQLEKMEKDLKTIIDSTHRQESKKIKQEVDKCKELHSAISNSSEVLHVADNHGSNSQVIEMTEKIRAECEYYEESIAVLCSRMRNVDYDIALDASLQQIMKRLNQFGRIDVTTTAAKLPPAPKLASSLGLPSASTKAKAVKPEITLTGKSANEVGEFCARFEEDTQDCWFTGAIFLPDGRILLADRTNRKLKLFTGNFLPLTELSLSSKPWDVALISNNEVAVTLPAECRIQFVTVDGSYITQTRSISTDEPCFGMCYTDGKILTVTYDGDPPNLKVLSPAGKELTYVCVDDDGFALFSKPIYVTCTPKATQIYVSDERMGCVINLKETGELNFNYSALDLGNAAGITLDKDGNIYVCGNTSNSVHMVSPSGERVKVLVTGETISYPRAIAYEPREKKLLVTQGDKDIVKVYSLA